METLGVNSVEGISALLYETDDRLIGFSLKKLLGLVDHYWAEIASHMTHLEALYENDSFKYREMTALILSKLFYHLSEYQEALNYALLAGDFFDVTDDSEFVETMLTRILDTYISFRKQLIDDSSSDGNDGDGRGKSSSKGVAVPSSSSVNLQIEQLVERMLSRCFTEKEYRQAIGIAIECRRNDLVIKALQMSGERLEAAYYILTILPTVIFGGEFFHDIMKTLVDIFKAEQDYISVGRCYAIIGDGDSLADLLLSLMNTMQEDNHIMSYNVAFDFLNNASESTIEKAWISLQQRTGFPSLLYDEVDSSSREQASSLSTTPKSEKEKPILNETNLSGTYAILENYRSILSGKLANKLYSEFLYRSDHTDVAILRNMKNWLEMRGSVHQVMMILSNAIMRFGTFNMQFLKENVELLRRQTHWGRFNAVATSGLIFRGHHQHAMSLLQPHLNSRHQGSPGYSEGGAYFALGLIHVHHGYKIKKELVTNLKTADNENVQHGLALGLAVAAFGTGDEEVYETLKTVLYMDNAISGEAASYAMGLVMCGQENDIVFNEMLEYARETQHEKIIRGLSMALAFMMYGRQHHAQKQIDELCGDKDALIRYGGMYMCGLAYAGTNNNEAIRRLLHCAVSDVSDDVRRAAVTCIGFLMFRESRQCPKVVQLLSESFNPHVRYGAAMAIGIACSGSGLPEAIETLQVLTIDSVDFVRQGAFIALGMVLMQHNELSCPDFLALRKTYDKVISERNEDSMAKIGAILGQGLMDAGGRNCMIALQSKSGYPNKMGITGLAMFLQYWYWHPLVAFIGTVLEPTVLIGLNPKLNMPKLQFTLSSTLRPGLMNYPAPIVTPTAPAPQKITTAILSTATKSRLRAKKEKRLSQDTQATSMMDTADKGNGEDAPNSMNISTTALPKSTPKPGPSSPLLESEKSSLETSSTLPTSLDAKDSTLPSSNALAKSSQPVEDRSSMVADSSHPKECFENPTRMLYRYFRSAHLVSDRYEKHPLIDLLGIIVLHDKRPQEEETIVSLTIPAVVTSTNSTATSSTSLNSSEELEPPAPEPFELPEEFASGGST